MRIFKRFFPLMATLFMIPIMTQAMEKRAFFDAADQFYQQYVKAGLVAYAELRRDPGALPALIEWIGKADIRTFSDTEKLAFYINAYNLTVIRAIVDHYPTTSPMEIKGFFDEIKHPVAGEMLTLNDLENTKIRTTKDPRVHFVLVCAALGCPKLASFSYHPEMLEAQLEQQTNCVLNDPDFIRVSGKNTAVSEIFKWYRDDFGGSDRAVIIFINRYRKEPLRSDDPLKYYTYNWQLNELK